MASEALVAREGIGLRYADLDDLVAQLHDRPRLAAARAAAWTARARHTFDAHADALAGILRRAAAG